MADAAQPPQLPMHNGVAMAAFPPEGWVVDVDNPTRIAVLEHYCCFAILGVLALAALIQRFYVKIYLSKGLQSDDFIIFGAWILSMTTQCMMINLIVTKSLGVHTWEIPLQKFLDAQVIPYVVSAVYQLCTGLTKLSLLVFYLNISPQNWWRISIWITMIFVILSTVVLFLMLLIHCNPVAKAYDLTILNGSCLDVGILYMLTAAQNIATDLVLFGLPIPMILGLRMAKFQKIAAMAAFGIGSLTIATSVVRLVYLLDVLSTTDLTWSAAKANVWIIIEANMFIICASMPTLRKFFKHFAPKLVGSSNSNNDTTPSKYGRFSSKELETVGGSNGLSRKQRRQYESFGEHELEMLDELRGDRKKVMMNEITVDSGTERSHADNASDKAILQTTTFKINYDE